MALNEYAIFLNVEQKAFYISPAATTTLSCAPMSLTISRILHAGYVFACDGTTIAFDPIVENPFSRNCHAFPDVRFERARFAALKLDAVFISHFHDDHCSFESLELLDRATPIYLYCLFDELFAMLHQLGFRHVHALAIDRPVQIGAIDIIARRALDADVDSLFHVRAAGLNVLNVVDAWMDPQVLPVLAAQAPWDMVLWPFQTMRETAVIAPTRTAWAGPTAAVLPEEWCGQLQALAPRYVVPSSCQFVQEPWSWYNHAMFPLTYAQFAREVTAALPACRVVRMNPGTAFVLDATALTPTAPLDWVLPVGPQDVDYAYEPERAPPATSDIARRFAALTAPQQAFVDAYCRTGLPDTYRAMELPDDSYFQQPRLWRLTVYDHTGAPTRYHYRLHGDAIELAPEDSTDSPGWTTEIPACKIYAALELGESLTSMYMRINDHRFDAHTDAQLDDADLVDDPLIRCLFDGRFGAYQAAQLKRIVARQDGQA